MHFRLRPSLISDAHLCYTCSMSTVASRELRNHTRALLRRVEAGEAVTITVDGRPVAILQPVGRRPRWLPQAEFVRLVFGKQADADLSKDLAELVPDTTDDLPAL
jgi:prevent-host-death family protein